MHREKYKKFIGDSAFSVGVDLSLFTKSVDKPERNEKGKQRQPNNCTEALVAGEGQ